MTKLIHLLNSLLLRQIFLSKSPPGTLSLNQIEQAENAFALIKLTEQMGDQREDQGSQQQNTK